MRAKFKRVLKSIGHQMGMERWVKELVFQIQKVKFYHSNRAFTKNNPGILLPADRMLFETFQLNYQKYFNDGQLCAKEIIEWTLPYLNNENLLTILDWGCGSGRVIQHMYQFVPYSLLYGADTNSKMLDWNTIHIKDVHFSDLNKSTKSSYPTNFFNLIYGISVFTHLPVIEQEKWKQELTSILKPSGILLLSTQGNNFTKNLLNKEILQLKQTGHFEKAFPQKNGANGAGNRNFSSYHTYDYLLAFFSESFSILHFYDGQLFPEKMGGQDLWLLQKK